jgi:gluconolactonase
MKRNPLVVCALLLNVSLAFAAEPSAPAAPVAPAVQQPISFFVTSVGAGNGANLGGLAGADAHCQKLAAAAGATNKNWHAYLSTQAANGQPAVNARDRIGAGPWYNARGVLVAKDVAHLHGDELEAARLGNNLSRTTALTEKNEAVKGAGDKPNEHDILTGSQADGRAYSDAADHTCSNYTSNATEGSAQVGHFDRTGGGNTSWNSAHGSRGCSQDNLVKTGGAGLLYCFAVADSVTPAIAGVVAAGTPITLIKEGFDGTEGPIAAPDGSLLFTETRANRITRIAADDSTLTFLENSNGSNGLALNKKGELISVQVLQPRVGIIYPQGKEKVLAEQFEDVAFVRPNDLVLSNTRGDIYFTDSGAALLPPNVQATHPPITPRPAVYRIKPDGTLLRIANDIERPNGIQLSPDEKVLYVANTLGEYIFAYDVARDGSISGKRNFAKLDGYKRTDNGSYSSGADGLAVDEAGRLYVASTVGIQVFSAKGEALGTIPLPKAPQNLAFAGKDKKTLYIVGRGAAYRIAMQTAGYAGRAK